MLYEPFVAPMLKVQRAKRHISEFEAELRAYLMRHPYRLAVEDQPELARHAPFCIGDGSRSLVLRVAEEPPCELPLFIGDAIHNLRAALDLLACDLVQLNGKSIKGVYFPFCKDGEDLETMIKRRHIDRAAPDVVDIIRSLKPYPGGNNALRGIHDLDITDKHETIVPIVHFSEIPTVAVGHSLFIDEFAFNPIEDGRVIVAFSISEVVTIDGGFVTADGRVVRYDNTEVDYDFEPSIEISFADGQPFEHEPVVPTLHQLAQLVDGIVLMFKTHCLGQ